MSFKEVELNTCPFWIQVHELPLKNMTTLDAIRIGKSLGSLLEVENGVCPGIIYSHRLHIHVEIDT
jgi:hypothetical protein